jgi:hypothetical protein
MNTRRRPAIRRRDLVRRGTQGGDRATAVPGEIVACPYHLRRRTLRRVNSQLLLGAGGTSRFATLSAKPPVSRAAPKAGVIGDNYFCDRQK